MRGSYYIKNRTGALFTLNFEHYKLFVYGTIFGSLKAIFYGNELLQVMRTTKRPAIAFHGSDNYLTYR